MIQQLTARKILVVCLGNHCRSPLAATILAYRGAATVDVRSAGLAAHHVDRPAHPLIVTAARQLGYDLTPQPRRPAHHRPVRLG